MEDSSVRGYGPLRRVESHDVDCLPLIDSDGLKALCEVEHRLLVLTPSPGDFFVVLHLLKGYSVSFRCRGSHKHLWNDFGLDRAGNAGCRHFDGKLNSYIGGPVQVFAAVGV